MLDPECNVHLFILLSLPHRDRQFFCPDSPLWVLSLFGEIVSPLDEMWVTGRLQNWKDHQKVIYVTIETTFCLSLNARMRKLNVYVHLHDWESPKALCLSDAFHWHEGCGTTVNNVVLRIFPFKHENNMWLRTVWSYVWVAKPKFVFLDSPSIEYWIAYSIKFSRSFWFIYD